MVFAIASPVSAQRKPISPRACEGDMEVFWGLIRVMLWQKTCNSLFISYLIVIFEVELLFIELWMFLSFFPRIITQNVRITWGKMNSIRKDIDRVCDKPWYHPWYQYTLFALLQTKFHLKIIYNQYIQNISSNRKVHLFRLVTGTSVFAAAWAGS